MTAPVEKEKQPTVSKFLRSKIAMVQTRVWPFIDYDDEVKAAVATVCDALLDALDEKDAKP